MLILFDLDGTLLDSLEAWLQAYKNMLNIKDLHDDEIIDLFFFHHEAAFKKYRITDTEAFYSVLDGTLENYAHLVSAMEHVEETLLILKSNGHKLGILTSRRKSIAKLHCPGWLINKFDVFLDRNDAKPKPSPDGIFKACEITGIPLSQTIYVGDHTNDYYCAKAAGVPFIFFKQPQEKFWKHLSFIEVPSFSNFKQLPELVHKIQSHRTPTKKSE